MNTAPSDTRTSSAYFSQTCESERAGERLPASHALTRWDNAMGHRCAASKQCHIPEEDARAPQNDLTDFTKGQNNAGRARGTGREQPDRCFPQGGHGKGKLCWAEQGGGHSSQLMFRQHHSSFFFPLGRFYQKM